MNLLSLFSDQIGSSLIKQATGLLGESESGVTKAMTGLMPSLLGTLVNKGGTMEGASSLMNLLNNNADDSILDNIGGLFSDKSKVSGLMDSSGGILDGLLGDKLGSLTGMLSSFSGLKSGSMGGLMKLATPFLLGFLKRKIMNKGASGLMSLLGGQKKHIASAMPPGLSGISDLLGFGNFGKEEKVATPKVETKRPEPTKKKGGFAWLLPLLLIVAGAYWFMNRGSEAKVETPPVVEHKAEPKVEEPAPVVANYQMIDYPGGTFAGVRSVVSFDKMKDAFQEGYGALGKAGVKPTGPASGVFYTYDEEKKESDMVAAFPVATDGAKFAAPISVFKLPAGKAVMTEYMGDYKQSYDAHVALEKYMTSKGLKQSGAVLETYLVGPNDTQNPAEYKTQIYYFYE